MTTGSTWFCDCGEPTCKNTYIDLERIVDEEAHITWLEFRTGDDDGARSIFSMPVVFLADMLDQPEEQQQICYGDPNNRLELDCCGGEFSLETVDGYTSLLIDEEFITMLKEEVYGTV